MAPRAETSSGPVPGRSVSRRSLLLAGYGTRVLAFLIDLMTSIFAVWLLAFLGTVIGSVAVALLMILAFSFWYHVWRVAKGGQTWGMAVLGIRVAERTTGLYPVDLGRAFVRFVVAVVLGIVCIGGVLDLMWPLWDPLNQTLHDKVASTVVLRRL